MAYFSNGTEGMAFDFQCSKCKYGQEPCPIAFVQTHYNYDACNNDVATQILEKLVDDGGNCAMYKEFKKDLSIEAQKECALNSMVETLKSADNEITSAPYWIIVDPQQNMSCDPHIAAAQITGLFFCREDAEDFLKATRYNFSKRAITYCHSGTYSRKYFEFYNEIKGKK